MKKFIIIFIILLIAGSAGAFYFFSKKKPKIEVLETATVTKGDIRDVLVETGILQPQVGAQVKIGARATGVITQMKVKVGDEVKQGQLVAKIDDREIINSINLTKAHLEKAKATLEQVNRTYPQMINQAKADLDYSSTNLKRLDELVKQEYTTKDSVDLAKTKFEGLKANHKKLIEEYATQEKILKANIKELDEELNQQLTRHTYYEIYAPMTGTVASVTAQEGETVVTGLQVANLVTIIDPTMLELWIYVDESDIGKIKIGQPTEFTVDSYQDKVFKGAIENIYPQPVAKDNITYFLAIVTINKEDTKYLKTQMTCYVKIITNTKDDILIVNNAAVKFDKGKQVAYKVTENGKTEKTQLKIGIRGEENTEIKEGLQEGEIVATKLILPVDKNNKSVPANNKQNNQKSGDRPR